MSVAVESVISKEIAAGAGLYLAKAAKLIPPHRLDRPVAPSTLFRWITSGIVLENGEQLHLEALRLAGRYITTAAAIQRFIERQSTDLEQSDLPTIRTPSRRERDSSRAEKVLSEKYGI